jgi:hypothetical protein
VRALTRPKLGKTREYKMGLGGLWVVITFIRTLVICCHTKQKRIYINMFNEKQVHPIHCILEARKWFSDAITVLPPANPTIFARVHKLTFSRWV